MAPPARRTYRCPGCDTRKTTARRGPQYCRCNTRAPYRMVDIAVERVVDAVLGPRKED